MSIPSDEVLKSIEDLLKHLQKVSYEITNQAIDAERLYHIGVISCSADSVRDLRYKCATAVEWADTLSALLKEAYGLD